MLQHPWSFLLSRSMWDNYATIIKFDQTKAINRTCSMSGDNITYEATKCGYPLRMKMAETVANAVS